MGASAPAQPAGSITEEAAKCRAQPRDRLKRIVQGDLSAITMKAIEDQPARRYTTVRELSDDVRSFLNGRPVQARQQTAFYRANKFVRRNWVPVAAAAILVAGLSLATALVLRQASVAKEEARKAEKVNQFLNDMLSSAGDFAPDAKNFTVAQMLDASLPKLAISWKNDPAVEASLRMDLGWSYRTLFELDKSKAQFQQALEIYRQRGDQAGTANALAGLGADAASLGLPEEALKHLQSSTEAFEHLGRAAPSPAVVTAKLMLAEFLVLNLNRDFDHAFTLVDEALVLCARDSTVPRASEAYAYFIRGSALSDVGKAGEAETAALKSLDILQKDHNDSLLKGRTLYLLMILNARSRKTVAAAEYARQYYQLNLMRLGANHPSTLDTKIMLARCRADAGIPGEAGQDALDALTMLRKAYPPLSANLWNPINNTSHTLNLAGRFKDAEPLAREELAIMNQDVYPKTDPRRGQSLFELGTALAGEKKYKEAAQVFERSALNYEGSGPTWARRAKEAREQAAVLH
jgi:serine/threonine-protein kinase